MIKLKNLFIYTTWKCNLFCRHCWVNAGNLKVYNDLPQKQWNEMILNALDSAKDLGLEFIKLSGGEPYLLSDLLEKILMRVSDSEIQVSIETNGTIMNEQNLGNLSKISTRNLSSVNVSLDSPTASVHNSFRCSDNAFETTLVTIKKLIKNHIPVNIVYSVSEHNIQELDGMIQLCSQLGVSHLKINPILNVGRAIKGTSFGYPYQLDIATIQKLINKYLIHKQYEYSDCVEIYLSVPFGLSQLKNYMIKGTSLPIYDNCDYLETLSILPGGLCGLCGQAKEYPPFLFGDLNCETLESIWNGDKIQDYRNILKNGLEGICAECLANKICNGGCRISAYVATGKINGSNPFCEEYAKRTHFFLNRFYLNKTSK